MKLLVAFAIALGSAALAIPGVSCSHAPPGDRAPASPSPKEAAPAPGGVSPTPAGAADVVAHPGTASKETEKEEGYRRGAVFVRIEETVEPRDRPAYTPPVPVLGNSLVRSLARAGYGAVTRPEEADWRVEGGFRARFSTAVQVRGEVLHKYEGSVKLSVIAKDGHEAGTVEIPEFYEDGAVRPGVPEDEAAVLQMRRRLAGIVWQHLRESQVFADDPEIPPLLASLAADDSEVNAPIQGDDVVRTLVQKRFVAVPYLLDALADDRPVKVNAHYPGLTSSNAERLRIYHLADKALEEVFGKTSRLAIDSPRSARRVVTEGWEREWARFCPPFGDVIAREREAAGAKKD